MDRCPGRQNISRQPPSYHARQGYPGLCWGGVLDLTSVQVEGEVVYIDFRARSDGRDDLAGTGTLVIPDGLIHLRTFCATTETRPPTTGSERPRPAVSQIVQRLYVCG